jgi:hypothetical protein
VHIQLRRWQIILIAVLSILSASSSILLTFPTSLSLVIGLLANSVRTAVDNPQFAVKLIGDLLLLVSGVALLFSKPWSRYGYIVVAILTTLQAIFLSYSLLKTQNATIVPINVPALLAGLAVTITIYWIITALIFSYFRGTKNLATQDANSSLAS